MLFILYSFLFFHQIRGGPFYLACFGICVAGCEAACAIIGTPVAAAACLPPCLEGCGVSCAASCFSPQTKFIVQENKLEYEKNVSEIKIGDKVKTLNKNKIVWTNVVQNKKSEGLFEFINFDARNFETRIATQIQVTPSHGMIILKNDDFILKAAKYLVIGDTFISVNNEKLIVEKISYILIKDKYTPITDEGSVLASNVLISTLCDEEIVEHEQIWEDKINEWKRNHYNLFKAHE